MSIKEKIEKQLIECYSLKYNENVFNHPIRYIQASKSLIGINPSTPNEKLINWNSNFISQFKVNKILDLKISNVEYFASMINLEILLNEKKYNDSKDEILRLLQVSTGEPILELLLVKSIKDLVLLPVILSIYRTVKFCSGIEIKNAVFLAIDLFKSNKLKLNKLNHLQLIDIYTSIIELRNTKFIRNEEINNEINSIDYSIFIEIIPKQNDSKLTDRLIENGREILLKIINENDDILNKPENLLILDSIRIILRHRKLTEYDNVLIFSSKLIENELD